MGNSDSSAGASRDRDYTNNDVNKTAKATFTKSHNEPTEGQKAVAHVFDRANANKSHFGGGDTKDVCAANKQFSCWNDKTPDNSYPKHGAASENKHSFARDVFTCKPEHRTNGALNFINPSPLDAGWMRDLYYGAKTGSPQICSENKDSPSNVDGPTTGASNTENNVDVPENSSPEVDDSSMSVLSNMGDSDAVNFGMMNRIKQELAEKAEKDSVVPENSPSSDVDGPTTGVPYSEEDVNVVAKTVWLVAGGDSTEGQTAVAHVINNRAKANRKGFGGDNISVFSTSLNDTKRLEGWEKMIGPVRDAVSGNSKDPTNGALDFINPELGNPNWAKNLEKGVKIGKHQFYKEKTKDSPSNEAATSPSHKNDDLDSPSNVDGPTTGASNTENNVDVPENSPSSDVDGPTTGVPFTEEDLTVAAKTVWLVAGDKPIEEQTAVAHVINNRAIANKKEFGGDNISDVCKKEKQFVKNWDDKIQDHEKMEGWEKMIDTVCGAFDGKSKDPTNGALNFTKSTSGNADWTMNLRKGVKIGNLQILNEKKKDSPSNEAATSPSHKNDDHDTSADAEKREQYRLAAEALENSLPSYVYNPTTRMYYSKKDVIVMGKTVYYESWTQEDKGQIAVAHVIKSRAEAVDAKKRFGGDNIQDVCTAFKQFSCFNVKKPDDRIPERKNDYAKALRFARNALEGKSVDPTNGALYYINPDKCDPEWAKEKIKAIKIDKHQFFYEGEKKK